MRTKKVNKARLAGFVTGAILSFPLGILVCSELFEAPVLLSVGVLCLAHIVVGPIFYRKVVIEYDEVITVKEEN